LAQVFSAEEVQLLYQIAIHGRNEIELAPDENAGFFMTLLRMLAFAPGKHVMREASSLHGDDISKAKSSKESLVNCSAIAPFEPIARDKNLKKNVSDSQPVSSRQLDWNTILGQLNVQGMAQQLAKHCALQNFSDREVILCLSQEHKHLQANTNAILKLQSALEDYFAKPLKLKVVSGELEAETPALIEHQDKQIKQQQASDSINQDRFVLEAQAELEASLVAESIKPIL